MQLVHGRRLLFLARTGAASIEFCIRAYANRSATSQCIQASQSQRDDFYALDVLSCAREMVSVNI